MTVHLRINGISLFSLVLSFFSFLGMQFNCACCNVRCLKRNKMITRCLLRRRQWHPTPVLLPGKSHGRRSLEGCSPWGRWGLETTERLHFHFSLSCIGEGDGNPLQCSCLENPRDGGASWAAIYGVAQSRTLLKWLSSSSSVTEYRFLLLTTRQTKNKVLGHGRVTLSGKLADWEDGQLTQRSIVLELEVRLLLH